MIKNIIFDLSEVIISEYHGIEKVVERNTNIKLLSETVFIDDNKDNVKMANKEGIQGIVFENVKQLERQLKEMNIIL